MIRKALISGLTLLALSNAAKSTITFEDSGVWSQPRIYSGTTLATEPLSFNKSYTFKTKLENNENYTDTTILTGQIFGPQEFSWAHNPITLEPYNFSIRQHTLDFSNPGNYNIKFTLSDNQYLERDFQVVPEPSTLFLLSVGARILKRKKKYSTTKTESNTPKLPIK